MILSAMLALLAWLFGPFAPLVGAALVSFVWSIAVVEVRVVNETPTPTGPIPTVMPVSRTCFGSSATIHDRHGDIVGTAGDDVIVGNRGKNRIDAGAGDDLVCGGAGSDQLMGGPGHDRLGGGAGNDWLYDPENGEDDLIGGPGRDWCEIEARSSADCERWELFD